MASPFPVAGITHLLGLGEDQMADIEQWITVITEQTEIVQRLGDDQMSRDAGDEIAKFHAFLDVEIARRRATTEPADDILARMVRYVEPDGRSFTDTEIRTQAQFLLMAGHETTRALLANALYEVASDPVLFKRLRHEPDLAAKVVAETFRFYSPVQMIFRVCREETELGDERIAAGTIVCIGIAAAGRDGATTPNADEFDPDRTVVQRHLGLGLGAHYCVGAALSQLEAKIALETISARFETLAMLPGQKYDPLVSAITRCPRSVEVEFTPAALVR